MLTDLDDDVLRQLIDRNLLLFQAERLLEFLFQFRNITVDFSKPGQEEITATLGELVDG